MLSQSATKGESDCTVHCALIRDLQKGDVIFFPAGRRAVMSITQAPPQCQLLVKVCPVCKI